MYYFKPKIIDKIENFLNYNKNIIFDLSEKLNQPFNFIFLGIIKDKLKKLKDSLKEKRWPVKLFYSLKANNSPYLVHSVAENIDFEVSSLYELNLVNEMGNKVILNGPKDEKTLINAAKNSEKNLIVVNSKEEFEEFFLSKRIKNNFLIRIGNIKQKIFSNLKITRFGIDEEFISKIIEKIKKNDLTDQFFGFAFHVDSTSDDLKREYFKKIFHFTIEAINHNLKPKILNIGGGIRFNYVDKKIWGEITTLIQEKVLKNDSQYLLNNYNFGITQKNQRVFGEGNYYPYYHNLTELEQIEYILNATYQNEKIIKLIEDLNLKVYLELGRLILNQAGGSFFKVISIEKRNKTNHIVLNGKSTTISANLDILYDPIVIKKGKTKKNFFSGFIFGNSCLEDDIFYRRKINFEEKVEKNDLLYFHNTISYKTKIFQNGFIDNQKEINFYFDKNYQLIKKEII